MLNSLDPDQSQHFVGPFLDLSCLQHLSADNTGMQRVKYTALCISYVLQKTKPEFSDVHSNMKTVWLDMQEFGCVMCELFLASKLHMQNPDASLHERYRMIGQICTKENSNFPR